jgi:predicted TIM-barrel fold metal-dependent hydrolase
MKKLLFLLATVALVCACGSKTEEKKDAQTVARAIAGEILLKDYEPVSIFNVPVTNVEKAKYGVIDMHSHDYNDADLEKIAAWVKTMDECGIRHTHILHCEWIGAPFEEMIAAYGNYPDRFSIWCSLDYTDIEAEDWEERAKAHLDRCKALGAFGIGEMVDKGLGDEYSRPVQGTHIHLDHPKMQSVLEYAGELGMPISIHVGEPIWMYEPIDNHNDGLMNGANWTVDTTVEGCYDYDGVMDCFVAAAKAHPNTPFIACHYLNMSHDWERLGRILDECPNVYVDISARIGESSVTPRATRRFIEKYADRIFFGTDNGTSADMYRFVFRILETDDEHIYQPDFGYHWSYSAYDLPDHILRKLYYENAEKFIKKYKN